MSTLQKMSNNGTFARIVIDEAHCVSQLGHDFRPDYQKLSILRNLFPAVPILALSATCPPNVLKDLLKILKMDPVVDGKSRNIILWYIFTPRSIRLLPQTLRQKEPFTSRHLSTVCFLFLTDAWPTKYTRQEFALQSDRKTVFGTCRNTSHSGLHHRKSQGAHRDSILPEQKGQTPTPCLLHPSTLFHTILGRRDCGEWHTASV